MKHAPQLVVVMDDIAHIKFEKDTSLVMLLAAQSRGYQLHYAELADPDTLAPPGEAPRRCAPRTWRSGTTPGLQARG